MLRSFLRSVNSPINAAKIAIDTAVKSIRPVSHNVQSRNISVSSAVCLKQSAGMGLLYKLFTMSSKSVAVEQVTEGNVTKVEGKIVESERSPYVLKPEGNTGCSLCKIHPHLKYTDVLILSQFLRPDGCLLPHYVTGVCWSQQKRLEVLVNKAQRAGLLPQFRPALKSGKPRNNHRSNYKWKRYNVYFKN